MKVLKAIHNMFATGNVAEDISFVGYLLAMSSVGIGTIALCTPQLLLWFMTALGVLVVATVCIAMQQQEEE